MRAIVDGWCLEWGFTISCLMGVKGNRKAPWTRVKQWPLDPGTNWMAPYSQFEQFLFKSKTRGENTQRMRFWSCFIGTRGTRERKREWVAICWCERVAMGFVTSWFSFLGGQMFENPCLHGSHRKYMWLASIPVSVSKKMIHIRFRWSNYHLCWRFTSIFHPFHPPIVWALPHRQWLRAAPIRCWFQRARSMGWATTAMDNWDSEAAWRQRGEDQKVVVLADVARK